MLGWSMDDQLLSVEAGVYLERWEVWISHHASKFEQIPCICGCGEVNAGLAYSRQHGMKWLSVLSKDPNQPAVRANLVVNFPELVPRYDLWMWRKENTKKKLNDKSTPRD